MPRPGSHSYDVQKQRLRRNLEEQGVDDDTADDVADDTMHRKAERGDDRARPHLPPQASPSANPPGEKHQQPDVPSVDYENELTDIAITELGDGRFGVEIDEGGVHTSHRIEVSSDVIDALGDVDADRQAIVRESIGFLLDREPSTRMPDEFSLDAIADRFPDFTAELASRLSVP